MYPRYQHTAAPNGGAFYGVITVATGSRMDLAGGVYALPSTCLVQGGGRLTVTTGVVNINAQVTISIVQVIGGTVNCGPSFVFTVGVLIVQGGTVNFVVVINVTWQYTVPAIVQQGGNINVIGGGSNTAGPDLQVPACVQQTGGIFTVNGTMQAQCYNLTGTGVIDGLGSLTVLQSLYFSGGTMRGSGSTISNGTLLMSGANKVLSGRALEINNAGYWSAGDVLCDSNGSITVTNQSTLTINSTASSLALTLSSGRCNLVSHGKVVGSNAPASTVTIGASVWVGGQGWYQTSGSVLFTKNGTFASAINIAAGAQVLTSGEFSVESTSDVQNAGTFKVVGGVTTIAAVLTTNGTVLVSGGSIVAVPNFTLPNTQLQIGSGVFNFSAGNGFVYNVKSIALTGGRINVFPSSAGRKRAAGETVHVNGSVTQSSGELVLDGDMVVDGDYAFSGDVITGSGSLSVQGDLLWTGGLMSGSGSTTALKTLTMRGGSKNIDARRIINEGNATWWQGDVWCRNGGVFENALGASALINGTSGSTLSLRTNDSSVCRYDNEGSLYLTSGQLNASVYLTNAPTGYIYVCHAQLHLLQSASLHGHMYICPDAAVDFINGTVSIGSDLVVDGDGYFGNNGAVVEYNCAQNDTDTDFTLTSGTLIIWPNSTCVNAPLRNLVLLGGSVIVKEAPAGFVYRFNSIQMSNSVSVLVSPTAHVQVNSLVVSGGTLTNMFVVEANTSFVLQGGSLVGSGDYVANATFQWTSGSFGGSGTQGQVITRGTGTISGAADKLLTWWTLVNQGSLAWSSGKLTLANGSVITNTGSLTAGNSSSTLALVNGTLSNTGAGHLTVVGNVTASSLLDGSAGAITVATGATLSLTTGGRLCGCGGASTVDIAAGATVKITSTATLTFSAGVTVTGSGSLVIDTGATVTSNQTLFDLSGSGGKFIVRDSANVSFHNATTFGSLALQVYGGVVTFADCYAYSLATLELYGGVVVVNNCAELTVVTRLTIVGGLLTINGQVTCSGATQLIGAGTLVNGSGLLVTSGSVTWSSGVLAVAQVHFTGTAYLNGTSTTLLDCHLINSGSLQWVSGIFFINGSSVVENTGTWLASGASVTMQTGVFINSGTLTVSGANVVFFAFVNSTGTITVSAGSLVLNGGGHVCGCGSGGAAASVQIVTGARLVLNTGSFTFSSGVVITGAGSLIVQNTVVVVFTYTQINLSTGGAIIVRDSANVTCQTQTNITNPAAPLQLYNSSVVSFVDCFTYSVSTVELFGGQLVVSACAEVVITVRITIVGGVLVVNGKTTCAGSLVLVGSGTVISGSGVLVSTGSFTWTSGIIVVIEFQLRGTTIINGTVSLTVTQLINYGSVQWIGGTIYPGTGSIVNSGTWQCAPAAGSSSLTLQTGVFVNVGVLIISTGTITFEAFVNSTGSITVSAGSLVLNGGGHMCGCGSGGVVVVIQINIGATLVLNTGSFTFTTGVSVIGSGSLIVRNEVVLVTIDTQFNIGTGGSIVIRDNANVTFGAGTNTTDTCAPIQTRDNCTVQWPACTTYRFAAIQFNGGTYVVAACAELVIVVDIQIVSGVLIIEGTFTTIVSSTTVLIGGQVNCGGKIVIGGSCGWQGSQIIGGGSVWLGGSTIISGPGDKQCNGPTLINTGSVEWQEGTIVLIGGSTCQNNGTFTIGVAVSCSASVTSGWLTLVDSSVASSGCLTATSTQATFINYATVTMNCRVAFVATWSNYGSLTVASGALATFSRASLNVGSMVVVQSASVTFAADICHGPGSEYNCGGSTTIVNSTTIVSGSWNVDIIIVTSGCVQFTVTASPIAFGAVVRLDAACLNTTAHNVTLPGSVTIGNGSTVISGGGGRVECNGSLAVNGSTFDGCSSTFVIAPGARATIGGAGLVVKCGHLLNQGTLEWVGGVIDLQANATITNDLTGVWTVSQAAQAITCGCRGSPATSPIINVGRITVTIVQTVTIEVRIINSGLVQIGQGATVALQQGCEQTRGGLHLGGGSVVTYVPIVNNYGSTISGSGVVVGSIVNSGVIAPTGGNAGGKLVIDGDLHQHPTTAVLQFEIGGGLPVVDYNVISCTGSVTKGGWIQVVLVNGYAPLANSSLVYTVVTMTGSTGSYAGIGSQTFQGSFTAVDNTTSTSITWSPSGPASCPSMCSLRGTCSATQPATCQCAAGFTGADCAQPIVACPNACSGHGTCSAGVCVCEAGWSGADCSITPPTCAGGCSGNGACTSTGVCVCGLGFTGAACEQQVPDQQCSDCGGNGVCGSDGVCVCEAGWSGASCQISTACPNECSGHGTCNSATGQCVCDPTWHGFDCSAPENNFCQIFGDPHVVTFDQKSAFSFRRPGDYVITRTRDAASIIATNSSSVSKRATTTFENVIVQGRFAECFANASCLAAVGVKAVDANETFVVYLDSLQTITVTLNGQALPAGSLVNGSMTYTSASGVRVTTTSRSVELVLVSGLRIKTSLLVSSTIRWLTVTVGTPSAYFDQLEGLCGANGGDAPGFGLQCPNGQTYFLPTADQADAYSQCWDIDHSCHCGCGCSVIPPTLPGSVTPGGTPGTGGGGGGEDQCELTTLDPDTISKCGQSHLPPTFWYDSCLHDWNTTNGQRDSAILNGQAWLEYCEVSGNMNNETDYQFCREFCSLHGKCLNGACVCESGWTGANCSIPVERPTTGDDEGKLIGAIVGGTMGAVALMAAGACCCVGAGAFILLRFKQRRVIPTEDVELSEVPVSVAVQSNPFHEVTHATTNVGYMGPADF